MHKSQFLEIDTYDCFFGPCILMQDIYARKQDTQTLSTRVIFCSDADLLEWNSI